MRLAVLLGHDMPGGCQVKRHLALRDGSRAQREWLDAGIFAVDKVEIWVCKMAISTVNTLVTASLQTCPLCHTRSSPLARHGASLTRSPASKPYISRTSRSLCIVQARRGQWDLIVVFPV